MKHDIIRTNHISRWQDTVSVYIDELSTHTKKHFSRPHSFLADPLILLKMHLFQLLQVVEKESCTPFLEEGNGCDVLLVSEFEKLDLEVTRKHFDELFDLFHVHLRRPFVLLEILVHLFDQVWSNVRVLLFQLIKLVHPDIACARASQDDTKLCREISLQRGE